MQFESLTLNGACLIRDDASFDERGSFNRIFCAAEFMRQGIPGSFVQMGLSRTRERGTLRGMHFQHEPRAEGKLVRCMQGRVFDAIIDLRRNSETFRQVFTTELRGADNVTLYIPPGFAHGFLTLTDNVEIVYSMTEVYVAELADGIRWNDPAFDIPWPEPATVISQRDRAFKDFA